MDLSFSSEQRDDTTVVAISGEIDAATAPGLREHLHGHVTAGRHRLVLDLRQVTFCDSTGLGVMVGVFRRIRSRDADGFVRIVCVEPVLRVFRLTGLVRVFDVHTSLAGALDPDGAHAQRLSFGPAPV